LALSPGQKDTGVRGLSIATLEVKILVVIDYYAKSFSCFLTALKNNFFTFDAIVL